MAVPVSNPTIVFRGATAFFTTTFFDQNQNVVQPSGGLITLEYITSQGQQTNATVTLTPPTPPNITWIGEWDSRGAGPGPVFGSVHSVSGGIPYAVTDFNFILSANSANLVTF